MGYDRMQRIRDSVIVVLMLGLAGYLYHEAPRHPVVLLDEKPPLAVAQPIQGLELGKGPNLASPIGDFVNPDWRLDNVALVPNAATAPDQTKTALRLVETADNDRHRIETSVTGVTPGEVHTVSLYVKPAERGQLLFEVRDGKPGKYGIARFDLVRKAVVTELGDVSDSGIQEMPDGWFRCWAAMPYATNDAVFNFAIVTASGASYSGNGRAGLLIWGAQFELGDRPGGYARPTEKPPIAIAQPVRGLETGNGPNLASSVWDFTRPLWRSERITVVSNAVIAPDGTQTGLRLVETSEKGLHRIETGIALATPGEVHTLSLYVKPAERSGIQFEMRDGQMGKYGIARFDLVRKAVVAESGDVSHSGMQELPDGWFRCWAAMPYATDHAVFNFGLISASGAASYAGNGQGGLLVWGVQVEPGDRPGGYAADGPAKP